MRSQWERYSSLHSFLQEADVKSVYPIPSYWNVGEDNMEGILELRKEKSRDAARSRRGKENYEFYELAKLLPLPAAITSQLDKASIIRLSISYLKLRDFSSHGDPPWQRDGMPPNKSVKGGPLRRRNMNALAMEIFETHQGTHILQSVDGFAFALASDGRFLYVSETVSIYLGLSQVEMTGSSIFDYIHQQDHGELSEQLGLCVPQNNCTSNSGGVPSPGSNSDEGSSTNHSRSMTPPLGERCQVMNPSPSKGVTRTFCVRMKSTLTKRGVHVKCSGYRVVHIMASLRSHMSFPMGRKHPPSLLGLVGMAIALPPPTITELRIDSDIFITRLSPDFTVLYCEPIISDMMDLTAEDLTNKVLYEFCHAGDLQKLRKSHVDILSKGQVCTDYYRLMNKHGGYCWIQTCATTICNAKNLDDQNIIAINYIISGLECGNCVFDTSQLKNVTGMSSNSSSLKDQINQDTDIDCRKTKDKSHKNDNQGGISSQSISMKPSSTMSANNQNSIEGHYDKQSVSQESEALFTGVQSKLSNNNNDQNEVNDNCSMFIDKSNEPIKLDNKNSRRKAEKPRKRRRENETIEDNYLEDEFLSDHKDMDSKITRLISSIDDNKNNSGEMNHIKSNVAMSMRNQEKLTANISSPIPEDLSTKSVTIVHSPVQNSHLPNSTSNRDCTSDWTNTVESNTPDFSHQHTSVKDLEDVMNRHLPTITENPDSNMNGEMNNRYQSRHKPTIQWIGSHQNASDSLPASNLLRSIFANRESVIRSSRPQCYNDIPVSMLTPPSGDGGYKDPTNASMSSMPNGSKAPINQDAQYAASTYASTPLTVSMSCNAMSDSYSITPPSSVSPQDKLHSPFTDVSYVDSTTQCTSLPADNSAIQRIPVKPQAGYTLTVTSPQNLEYDHTKSTGFQASGPYIPTSSEYTHYSHMNNGNNTPSYDHSSHRSSGPWYSTAYTN
ncbi:protein trachealess-like isoform X2 [Octopus vulgaris]|uniref:Protein trachealess-like isoform X2 n=2 Tax=Octopus vulgaris TaxID=6645 RepID=A0AA36F4V4_OCTVU|nr:protein trachealess-like isoform X2 [Octopus vulgaris]